MFFTYILESLKNHRYYIGSTADVILRLNKHNKGWVKSTKAHRPWKLIYTEEFSSLSAANIREFEIKSWKSRKRIQRVINSDKS